MGGREHDPGGFHSSQDLVHQLVATPVMRVDQDVALEVVVHGEQAGGARFLDVCCQ